MTELDRLTSAIMNDFVNASGTNTVFEVRTEGGVRFMVTVHSETGTGGKSYTAEGASAIECYANLVKQGCYPIEEPKK